MQLIEQGFGPVDLRVLVFTPTPTHPAVQGNRQRVHEMCCGFQSVGASVTLLYYATEGVDALAARQMRETWGDLEVVFPKGFEPGQTFVRHSGIDDWYDEAITTAVDGLCSEIRFDVCVVNYAWYSKLFERLPASVVRILDTHDVFGFRADLFQEIGLDPKWFHTSAQQETLGLDRADFVIAIQDDEAQVLRDRTKSIVHTVGSLAPPNYLPSRSRSPGDRLIAGYLGSANPFNVAAIRSLAECIESAPEIRSDIEFHIAGPICQVLSKTSHPFVLRGIVDSLAEFYGSVDVVINPMLGGTGLKIKSLEALRFGKPLAATSDAMVGIPSHHSSHSFRDPAVLLKHLALMHRTPEMLRQQARVSQEVFNGYQRQQSMAFRILWTDVISAVQARNDTQRK